MGEQPITTVNPMDEATPEEYAEWKRSHMRLLDYDVTLENPLKMIALIDRLITERK